MVKNIIVVSDVGYVNGGNAKVAITSAIELSSFYNVIFFTTSEKIDEQLSKSKVQKVVCPMTEFIELKKNLSSLKSYIYSRKVEDAFYNLLDKYSPDDTLIHIHSWSKALSPSIFNVIKKLNFKCLVTAHDYFSVCPNGGLYNYKTKKICQKKSCGLNCTLTNCDSRSYLFKIVRIMRFRKQYKLMKNLSKNKQLSFIIISKYQEEIIKNVSAFKNCNFFFLQNPYDLYPYEKIDANSNDKFAMIGRVAEEKGVRLFCQVAEKLNLEAEVIGDGPIKKELELQYPRVSFLGWKDKSQINELMKDIRCLVFPSLWYEGAPLVIPEVLSAGIPCLVSSVCNGREYIEDGKNGFIFNLDDLGEGLTEAIEKVKDQDISVLSVGAYNSAKLKFGCGQLNEIIKIYDKVLK